MNVHSNVWLGENKVMGVISGGNVSSPLYISIFLHILKCFHAEYNNWCFINKNSNFTVSWDRPTNGWLVMFVYWAEVTIVSDFHKVNIYELMNFKILSRG